MFYFFQAFYANRSWWRSLKRSSHLPSSLNTALPSGQCKDIDRGSGGLPWWWAFGCRFWALKQPVKTTKNLNDYDYHIKFGFWSCFFPKYLCIFYPLPGSTLRQFDFHICFKCLVQPTSPPKRYVHSAPSMFACFEAFQGGWRVLCQRKVLLGHMEASAKDICRVRRTFE